MRDAVASSRVVYGRFVDATDMTYEAHGGHRVILRSEFRSGSRRSPRCPVRYRLSQFLHEYLEPASPDLLRHLLTTSINTLMSAEPTRCAAPSTAPVPRGHQHCDFDTRAGTRDVAIPKLPTPPPDGAAVT
jgi:hypothetical protein